MRTRGIIGHVITDELITGPMDSYALFVRPSDGRMLMVHSEGVGYEVRDDKPWKWNDYSPTCGSYAPADLTRWLSQNEDARQVDLADWIRVFGARLESNFAQNHHWLAS